MQPAGADIVVAGHAASQLVVQVAHDGSRRLAQDTVEHLVQRLDLAAIGSYPLRRRRAFGEISLYLDAPLGIQPAIDVSMKIAIFDGVRHHQPCPALPSTSRGGEALRPRSRV